MAEIKYKTIEDYIDNGNSFTVNNSDISDFINHKRDYSSLVENNEAKAYSNAMNVVLR